MVVSRKEKRKEKGIFATEIAKVMKKQQGYLILFIFVIIKLLLTIAGGYATYNDYIIKENEVIYKKYINEYKGKITKEKEEAIKQEYEHIYFADTKINEYAEQLEEGMISKEEYQNRCKFSYEKLKEKKAFEVFYSKYTYAKEEPENRYILDTRGWETLLRGDFDYLFILVLVVLVSIIFTQEMESDMEDILLSSKNGGKKLVTAKLKTGICIGIILFIVFQSFEIGYLLSAVGLEGVNYPLKSISSFATSNFNISLGQAYMVVLVIQILGVTFAVVQILLIGLCLKKMISSMAISMFALLFPMLLNINEVINFLPVPFVMLKAVTFIQGNIYVEKAYYGTETSVENNIIVEAMSSEKCFIILGMQLIYIILFCLLIYYKYLNMSLHRKAKETFKHKKNKGTFSIILLVILMFSGCGRAEVKYSGVEVFEEEQQNKETELNGHLFQLDHERNLINMTNIANGNMETLSRDIYVDDMKITAFYVTNNACYYLKENQTDSGIQLWKISLTDRNEKLLYNSCRQNRQDFYGLIKSGGEIEKIFDSVETSESLFMYQERYIFWRKGADLYRLDLSKKIQERFVDDIKEGTYYIVKKDRLFYINSSYQVCIKHLVTGQKETLSVYGKGMEVREGNIYYYDLLYGGEKRKLNY